MYSFFQEKLWILFTGWFCCGWDFFGFFFFCLNFVLCCATDELLLVDYHFPAFIFPLPWFAIFLFCFPLSLSSLSSPPLSLFHQHLSVPTPVIPAVICVGCTISGAKGPLHWVFHAHNDLFQVNSWHSPTGTFQSWWPNLCCSVC